MDNLQPIGKYKLIRQIGAGGFGTVYLAEDTKLGSEVALKVIHAHISDNPAFRKRFFEEIKAARSLGHHPNLISIYDSDEVDGKLFLTMPYISGRTLRQRFKAEGVFTLETAIPILTQLAAGLDLIHRKAMVHRDVKPENIMLTREESDLQVILLDFGLVRSLDSSVELTKSQGILGSAVYISPEQVNPSLGNISPQSDVYSLGVLIYELLTGAPPFDGAGREFMAVWHDHGYTEPPPPAGLSRQVSDILLRALAKNPADRFATASEFVNTLAEQWQKQQRALVKPTQLEALKAQATIAREAKNWAELQRLCTRIMSIDRNDPALPGWMRDITNSIERAQKEQARHEQWTSLHQQGADAIKYKKWDQAIDALEKLLAETPDFRDASALLNQAKQRKQEADWYSQVIRFNADENWIQASQIWLQLLTQNRSYDGTRGGTELLKTVEGLLKLEKERHDQIIMLTADYKSLQSQLRSLETTLKLFNAFLKAIDPPDWGKIAILAKKLNGFAPQFDQLPIWLKRAQAQQVRKIGISDKNNDMIVWGKDGKTMVCVPAGEFLYGEGGRPQTLPEYWIDKTPVTNAEYAHFVEVTGYKAPRHWNSRTPPSNRLNHPVVNVSLGDVAEYAKWANKRLPSEMEWEKAARGTQGNIYPWGSSYPEKKYCNFNKIVGDTTPVGKYSPLGDSPYGCVDMAGNVWEWTVTDYDKSSKVLRGGGWNDSVEGVRAVSRYGYQPGGREVDVGFRCVVSQANGS